MGSSLWLVLVLGVAWVALEANCGKCSHNKYIYKIKTTPKSPNGQRLDFRCTSLPDKCKSTTGDQCLLIGPTPQHHDFDVKCPHGYLAGVETIRGHNDKRYRFHCCISNNLEDSPCTLSSEIPDDKFYVPANNIIMKGVKSTYNSHTKVRTFRVYKCPQVCKQPNH